MAAVFGAAVGPDAFGGRFEAFFDLLYAEFERPERWLLFDDVLPCLEKLSRSGLPVGVVSNWDSRLLPVLRGHGIVPLTAFVLTSAEFGAEKPHPAIFREGVARLGVPAGQVLHVGDLLEEDVRGAWEAGLQAAWLRRDPAAACPRGVPCIRHLGEIAALWG